MSYFWLNCFAKYSGCHFSCFSDWSHEDYICGKGQSWSFQNVSEGRTCFLYSLNVLLVLCVVFRVVSFIFHHGLCKTFHRLLQCLKLNGRVTSHQTRVRLNTRRYHLTRLRILESTANSKHICHAEHSFQAFFCTHYVVILLLMILIHYLKTVWVYIFGNKLCILHFVFLFLGTMR